MVTLENGHHRLQAVTKPASRHQVPTLESTSSQTDGNSEALSAQTDPSADMEHLPGEPRILLMDEQMGAYLFKEFTTAELDQMEPYMGWMASQDSSHISSLTKQIVRGRKIVITEEPRLHLVWYYDQIFIKPIPEYLLSHAVWEFYLTSEGSPVKDREKILRAVCGFMRSYGYLVRHASDFALATKEEHRLIPERITYSEFIRFIKGFENIRDENVSPRWGYGELRLSRLNLWSKILLTKFTYQKMHGQYGAQFAQFYGPILFVFAIISIVLSAMQVAISVQPLDEAKISWKTFAYISRVFAIATIVCTVCISMGIGILLFAMLFREGKFALKAWFRKRRERQQKSATADTSDRS